jgi:hypothetical protein
MESADCYAKGSHPTAQLLGYWLIMCYLQNSFLYSVGGNFRDLVLKNRWLVMLVVAVLVPLTAIFMSADNYVSCIMKVRGCIDV